MVWSCFGGRNEVISYPKLMHPFSFCLLSFSVFFSTRILLRLSRVYTVSSRERNRARPKIAEAARPSPSWRPCGDSTMTEALSVSLRLPLCAVVWCDCFRLSFPRYLFFFYDLGNRWFFPQSLCNSSNLNLIILIFYGNIKVIIRSVNRLCCYS